MILGQGLCVGDSRQSQVSTPYQVLQHLGGPPSQCRLVTLRGQYEHAKEPSRLFAARIWDAIGKGSDDPKR